LPQLGYDHPDHVSLAITTLAAAPGDGDRTPSAEPRLVAAWWDELEAELALWPTEVRAVLGINYLSARGVEQLARLPGVEGLQDLSLDGNKFLATGARVLAEQVPLCELRKLELGGTQCGNEGVAALSTTPTLARLESLGLRSCELGDAGAAALGATPHGRSFASSAGARAILAASGLDALAELRLDGNPSATRSSMSSLVTLGSHALRRYGSTIRASARTRAQRSARCRTPASSCSSSGSVLCLVPGDIHVSSCSSVLCSLPRVPDAHATITRAINLRHDHSSESSACVELQHGCGGVASRLLPMSRR
jgi:hypothetical protein